MKLKAKVFLLLLFCCFSPFFLGQTQKLTMDRGATGLVQALARLPLISRAMFIAAHPDDERAGVLAYVSRGLNAKTALLTLTRGEGGQNLISEDLFEALGLLRTGELLAAGEYYGVEQYFTRAFDFGFSKSSTETLQKWDRAIVLHDMVRAIRKFRPQVIVSFWQGTSCDGHGHHQASGILAREAFQLSGDPQRFPELLREGLLPWRARKFYIGNPDEQDSFTLKINTGEYIPLLGASFHQIGAQGYSWHRTQGMGSSYAAPGNHFVSFRRVVPGDSLDSGFLGDLDVRLAKLSKLLDPNDAQRSWLESELSRLEALIQEAQDRFLPSDFSGTYDPLLKGITKLREIRQRLTSTDLGSLPKDHLHFLLADKEQDFVKALDLATGLSFEALADDALVTPGQSFMVTAAVVNRSSTVINVKQIRLLAESGWRIEQTEGSLKSLSPQEKLDFKFKVSVPSDAALTQPHWKRTNKEDAVYSISQSALINAPLPPPVMRARLDYTIGEVNLIGEQAVEYRDSDRVKGTRHIPILVVPAVAIEVTPPLHLVSLASASHPKSVQVKLINNSKSQLAGSLLLKAPAGWGVEPKQRSFSMENEGEAATLKFQVAATDRVQPAKASFEAVARVGGKDYDQSYRMVSVFDLWRNPLYSRAASEVITLDVRVPEDLSVGYIMGAGDKVPQTLSQLGVEIKLLEAEDLAEADLSRYPCIIAGVRAYEVRRDLIASNPRLLDYVKKGGVYIVQYNTPAAWNKSQYAPYPAKIQSSDHRVTDETAPVKILDPQHPVFNVPNKITDEDFENWVQERGLYFIQERDSRFQPLLSTSDPGEAPLDGGLLIAEYGRGTYVLTSYSWFRQLPEGVAGAIRLFANLISLSETRRSIGR